MVFIEPQKPLCPHPRNANPVIGNKTPQRELLYSLSPLSGNTWSL